MHSASGLRQCSSRLIVSTKAVLVYRIFLQDVDHDLQCKEKLTTDVYLLLRPQHAALFGIEGDQILKVVLPLYGIPDAGDSRAVTAISHT